MLINELNDVQDCDADNMGGTKPADFNYEVVQFVKD